MYLYRHVLDRVFEIRRTEGGRFSAGPTEASYLAVLLSAKHFFVMTADNLLFMKPGQIGPLYLEPRLHKQSVK
jgi:hypothetical protein